MNAPTMGSNPATAHEMSPARSHRIAPLASAVLGAMAVVGLVASVFGVWAHTTLFDSDRVAAAVEETLEQPEVISALAVYVTDQIEAVVSVDPLIEAVLPGPLNRLGQIITGEIRAITQRAVEQVLATEQARAVMVGLSRETHAAAVRVLRGESAIPGVTTADGEVTVNLLPIMGRAFERVQVLGVIIGVQMPELTVRGDPAEQIVALERAFGRELPDDLGQLVVYRSEALDDAGLLVTTARDAVVFAERTIWVILILTVVGAVGAVALARDRRRAMVVLALGIGAALLVARVIIARVIAAVPDVVVDPGARRALVVGIDQLASGLLQVVTTLALIGLAAGVVALLTGRRPVAALRQR